MINLALVVVLTMLAFARPGAGIAVALALGRHTFPDRTDPIVAAAPLLLAAATLGLLQEGRRIRLTPASILGASLLGIVTLVGYLASSDSVNPDVVYLAGDKTFFLLAVSIPLLLLAPSLDHRIVRRDCLLTLVLVPIMLVLITIASGSTDANSGRSAALGGGPITLATAAGFAILILIFHDDELLPRLFAPFSRVFRIGAGAFLLFGIVVTGSRQPLLSLMMVIGLAFFTAASTGSLVMDRREMRRRIRRIRAASMTLVVAGALGFVAFVTARPESRFALLMDPSAELRRSRLPTWGAGFEQARSSGLLGHGFGSFATFPFPHQPLAYPHNIFLELWSEVGLVLGTVAAAAIVIALVRARRDGLRVLWLLAAYAFLGAQVSGDLYNSRYFMFFTVAALTVRLPRSGPEETDTGDPQWVPTLDPVQNEGMLV